MVVFRLVSGRMIRLLLFGVVFYGVIVNLDFVFVLVLGGRVRESFLKEGGEFRGFFLFFFS